MFSIYIYIGQINWADIFDKNMLGNAQWAYFHRDRIMTLSTAAVINRWQYHKCKKGLKMCPSITF